MASLSAIDREDGNAMLSTERATAIIAPWIPDHEHEKDLQWYMVYLIKNSHAVTSLVCDISIKWCIHSLAGLKMSILLPFYNFL